MYKTSVMVFTAIPHKIVVQIPRSATLLILCILPLSLMAQEGAGPRVLTMQEAVNIALRNTTELKNLELEKKAERGLILSEFDLAPPSLSIETGEINSALYDYKVAITQDIQFPMVYVEQVAAQKARAEATDHLADMKRTELLSEVKSTYMQWWVTSAKLSLKLKQDSIFGVFSQATARQYETGETNQLDLLLAQSRKARISLEARALVSDLSAIGNDLKTMIHADDDYIPPPVFPEKLTLPALPADGLNGNPAVRYLESSLRFEKASLRREWWRLAPSFSVGWFTQSLDEVSPFTGWTYGISLPVWFWVPMGKIRSASIRRDVASNEIENGIHHLQSSWFRYRQEMDKAANTLSYFDEQGLSLSRSMVTSAEKSYKAGEISLFQYIFSLNEAFSLQLEYLDALNTYNQTIIQINRLQGTMQP